MTKTNQNNKRKSGVALKDAHITAIARKVFLSTLERKVNTVSVNSGAVATTGGVIDITNPIIEGDDIFNRNGTTIRLHRFRMLIRATAVGVSASVRFILFRDMLNQGSIPSVTNLLSNTNFSSQYSDVREIQQHRFHIIKDEMLDVSVNGESVKTKQFDFAVQGNVYFNGALAGAPSNGKGAVFLLIIGSSATPTYDLTVQTIFTDV